MKKMTITQEKISKIVEEYQTVFKAEYDLFCNAMADKREVQNDEFASGVAGGQFAYEIPLTLHNMFDSMLTDEEKKELRTKEMAQWFGRKFKQFSPAQRI